MTIGAGLLLIIVPLAFNAGFFALQRMFEYPDILRRPTDEILRRFRDGGPNLRAAWYGFALSAVLFMPVPLMMHLAFGPSAPWYLSVGTALGVLAGLVQFLGLARWPFVVPYLAETYAAPGASAATREAATVVFQALHRYAGNAIGEHLGYLLTAAWTALLSLAILATGIFHWAFGLVGLVAAAGVFAGTLELAGVKAAAMINALSYVLWSLWLIALGIAMFFLP